jgi:hypothetical protein
MGCNEGGYAFSALERGARHVDAVDCRPVNVEKGRFVAKLRSASGVSFDVADVDSWLAAHPGAKYDYVFLFGLLYHLPEPWRTIQSFCEVAREGVLLTCVLAGGDDGYTVFHEQECIGASFRAQTAMMPNTTRTLVHEFARHGFYPAFLGENRTRDFWGGCSLLAVNCRAGSPVGTSLTQRCTAGDVSAFLVPDRRRGQQWSVVAYNWSARALDVTATLRLSDGSGVVLDEKGPHDFTLPPRVHSADGTASCSVSLPLPLVPAPGSSARLELCERGSGRELVATEVAFAGCPAGTTRTAEIRQR